MPGTEWVRLLLMYVDDYLETQPEEFRQRARELIARRRYKLGNEIVDDINDEDWGLNYTVDLLPDDNPPIRLVRVPWQKVTQRVDRDMLDMLKADPPDDLSALEEHPDDPPIDPH
ncbi:hypothetical protein OHB24_27130 [Kribbella sp. NBC_00482]|uniref:hypothetical protein n=1 Tax=Kribbella sp. NBC_00482 TaxID=2975968 RepID=UPI002E17782F